MYAIESTKSNFCQNFALIGGIPHRWGGQSPNYGEANSSGAGCAEIGVETGRVGVLMGFLMQRTSPARRWRQGKHVRQCDLSFFMRRGGCDCSVPRFFELNVDI